MEIVNGPETKKYGIKCYNCGAEFTYLQNEIHRNPMANRAVISHGFTGHTGEVRCPGCGTFLPHYETNEID